MSAMQRNKGAAGERELAKLLSDELGVEIKRKLAAARDGGDDIEALGWSIECKRTEVFQSAFFAQAQRQSNGGKWVIFWRKSRQPWRAFVDAHDVNPSAFPNREQAIMQMDLPAWCQLARESI